MPPVGRGGRWDSSCSNSSSSSFSIELFRDLEGELSPFSGLETSIRGDVPGVNASSSMSSSSTVRLSAASSLLGRDGDGASVREGKCLTVEGRVLGDNGLRGGEDNEEGEGEVGDLIARGLVIERCIGKTNQNNLPF